MDIFEGRVPIFDVKMDKAIMIRDIIPDLPRRTEKSREEGITMVMDKGLGVWAARDLASSAGQYIDLLKLGFGTSILTPEEVLREKLEVYRSAGMEPYPGGTLWEAFYVRNALDRYEQFIERWGFTTIEISDGTLHLSIDEKCKQIEQFAKKYRVVTEVGYKDVETIGGAQEWIYRIKRELEAGAWKVILEGRESGSIGIYDSAGKVKRELVDAIAAEVPLEKIVWETPKKPQQVWFIKHFGTNVNLGNINPAEAIAVEALRLGLRGDTLTHFVK